MAAYKLLSLGFVLGTAMSIVACSAPAEEEMATGDAAALTADSIGVTCRTLGEIGQCGATTLCKGSTEAACRAKASAIESNADWARICSGMGNEQACGWQSETCVWEQESTCMPRSGKPSAAQPNLAATCAALGELGACGRVPACKASSEGVCHATDDAIAADPQWRQMCPRAGTTQEACEVQSNCIWQQVQTCTPRATAAAPLDIATACRTLEDFGACGVAPSICKDLDEPRCVAKPSALASNPDWARVCNANGSEQACGWQSFDCEWQAVEQCVPLSGPRPNAAVDVAKACDTLGQIGMCGQAPMCKPVVQGSCRATANALAGDPDWANQCPRAGADQDTCAWLAPHCTWEPTTSCVPQ